MYTDILTDEEAIIDLIRHDAKLLQAVNEAVVECEETGDPTEFLADDIADILRDFGVEEAFDDTLDFTEIAAAFLD